MIDHRPKLLDAQDRWPKRRRDVWQELPPELPRFRVVQDDREPPRRRWRPLLVELVLWLGLIAGLVVGVLWALEQP